MGIKDRLQQSSNLVVGLFGVVAIICSFVGSFRCTTIKYRSILEDSDDVPDLRYGIWRQSRTDVTAIIDESGGTIIVRDVCVKYPDAVDIDSFWKTARAASVIAPIFGFLLLVTICFPQTMQDKKRWLVIALSFMFNVTLFQGLTLLILKSNACDSIPLLDTYSDNPFLYLIMQAFVGITYDNTCELDSGSVSSIVATVFWFLTGLVMLVLGPPGGGVE